MGKVTRLYHMEEVRMDRERLDRQLAELGRGESDRAIARAMEDIAIRLTRIEAAFDAASPERIAKGARRLAVIADQAGMTTLRDIAWMVASVAGTPDGTALAACVARLVRAGEASLVTVSDVRDMSV